MAFVSVARVGHCRPHLTFRLHVAGRSQVLPHRAPFAEALQSFPGQIPLVFLLLQSRCLVASEASLSPGWFLSPLPRPDVCHGFTPSTKSLSSLHPTACPTSPLNQAAHHPPQTAPPTPSLSPNMASKHSPKVLGPKHLEIFLILLSASTPSNPSPVYSTLR